MALCMSDRPSLRAAIGWRPEPRPADPVRPAAIEREVLAQVADFQARRALKQAMQAVCSHSLFTTWHRVRLDQLQAIAPDVAAEAGYLLDVAQGWLLGALGAADDAQGSESVSEALQRLSEVVALRDGLAAALLRWSEVTTTPAETALSRATKPAISGLVTSLDLKTQTVTSAPRPLHWGASRAVLRAIADSVATVVRVSPKGSVAFLTVTLPLAVHDHLQLHPEQGSRIIRRFLEETEREWHRRVDERPFHYAGAREIHPGLWRDQNLVCSHWHLVFQGRLTASGEWVFRVGELEEILRRQIRNVTGLDVDCSASLNLQQARTKVIHEIAKIRQKGSVTESEATGNALTRYLSKGSSKLCQEIEEAGLGHLLPQYGRRGWHLCSHSVSRLVAEELQCRKQDWTPGMIDFLERHAEAFQDAGLLTNLYRLQPRIHEPTGMQFFGGLCFDWVSDAKRLQALRWCRDRYVPGGYRRRPPPPIKAIAAAS